MEKLDAIELDGKWIKLVLKNGKTMIGNLPRKTQDENFEKNFISFLPYEKSKDFHATFQKTPLRQADLNVFLKSIKREDILDFEIMESEISQIGIEGGKPMPSFLAIKAINPDLPGHINIKYSLPGSKKEFDLGIIQIKKSSITLPLKLVFICYAKVDKKAIKKIIYKLHDNGIITWMDEDSLLPGDNWDLKIKEAIEKSDYVLVFLSSKSINDIGFKNKEIRYALEQNDLRPLHKRYIIPFLIDECSPPEEFKKLHWIKITDKNWLKKLTEAISPSIPFTK